MFSSQQNDPRKKFWQTAELIEHLLPFLDFESTLKLAQSHALTLNILQIDSNWTKIIRRERPRPRKWSLDLEIEEVEEDLHLSHYPHNKIYLPRSLHRNHKIGAVQSLKNL